MGDTAMKYIALVLIFILPVGLWAQEESVPMKLDYQKGYAQGQTEGSGVGQGGWMAGGLAGGFLGGCIGGGIVWLVASGDTPSHIPDGPGEFQRGYIEGYKASTKSKKQQNAMIGGLIGTAVAVTVVLLVTSGD
jgi:hypothetical protein